MNEAPLVRPLFDGPVDVVGDVHGEIDALRRLLDNLGYGPDGTHPEGRRLVFVGDLVDRGPNSPAVVELVSRLARAGLAQCVLGNHELNILRDEPKPGAGNLWYFGRREQLGPPGTVTPQALADPDTRAATRAFFASLPLALERADLLVVHACWEPAMIDAAREQTDALSFYHRAASRVRAALDSFAGHGDPDRLLAEFGLRPADALDAFAGEVQASGEPPVERLRRSLGDETGHRLARQNFNPVKVICSGPERRAIRRFWASGKWRTEGRLPWWEDYDGPFCVFGHYWRSRLAGDDDGDHHFDDSRPYSALGDGRAMCIDYSVGKRWRERLAGGGSPSRTALAALRWPERWLYFDAGRPVPLQGMAEPRSEARRQQYRNLARDYFAAAERLEGPGNARIFLYLHAAEVLLKWRLLEDRGEISAGLEKTHDLASLAAALHLDDAGVKELAGLDPRGTRFRYPGERYAEPDPAAADRVRELTRALWQRFGGPTSA
jgi:hypothetical protein